MRTKTDNSDRMQPKFVGDRRNKTKSAAGLAERLCTWIQTADGMDPIPDEFTLFVALQTAAYRASRQRGRHTDSVAEWAARWAMIRDHLVERNLGLAFSMMSRYRRAERDWEDQRSEALFALVRAVEGFNPWRGFQFSTYACNAIVRAMASHSRRAARYRSRFVLDMQVLPESATAPDTSTDLFVERLQRALTHNLGELTDRESAILAGRFPMNGGSPKTLGQIGGLLGLSKERVRQLQNRALDKLRSILDADPLLQ